MNMLSWTLFNTIRNGTPLSAIIPTREYIREIFYPLTCLFYVWKDYPSFWKRRFEIEQFILLHLGVKLKFSIFYLPMIFSFSQKQKSRSARILKTFSKNSVSVLDKLLAQKNYIFGIHQTHLGEQKNWLLASLTSPLRLNYELIQELLFSLPVERHLLINI